MFRINRLRGFKKDIERKINASPISLSTDSCNVIEESLCNLIGIPYPNMRLAISNIENRVILTTDVMEQEDVNLLLYFFQQKQGDYSTIKKKMRMPEQGFLFEINMTTLENLYTDILDEITKIAKENTVQFQRLQHLSKDNERVKLYQSLEEITAQILLFEFKINDPYTKGLVKRVFTKLIASIQSYECELPDENEVLFDQPCQDNSYKKVLKIIRNNIDEFNAIYAHSEKLQAEVRAKVISEELAILDTELDRKIQILNSKPKVSSVSMFPMAVSISVGEQTDSDRSLSPSDFDSSPDFSDDEDSLSWSPRPGRSSPHN